MIEYRLRRATTDDLPQLLSLWQAAQLPVAPLEKRFTEFQVVEDLEGNLVAAMGLQVVPQQGMVHSETFADFSLAEKIRPLLWERVEKVAANHGLFRLWTQETAPFWKQAGFNTASSEVLVKRPANFASDPKRDWLVLQLKAEAASPINLDKEFERFKESERANTEDLYSQAKMLKWLATIIAIIVAVFSIIMLIRFLTFMRRNPGATNPPYHQRP